SSAVGCLTGSGGRFGRFSYIPPPRSARPGGRGGSSSKVESFVAPMRSPSAREDEESGEGEEVRAHARRSNRREVRDLRRDPLDVGDLREVVDRVEHLVAHEARPSARCVAREATLAVPIVEE